MLIKKTLHLFYWWWCELMNVKVDIEKNEENVIVIVPAMSLDNLVKNELKMYNNRSKL